MRPSARAAVAKHAHTLSATLAEGRHVLQSIGASLPLPPLWQEGVSVALEAVLVFAAAKILADALSRLAQHMKTVRPNL